MAELPDIVSGRTGLSDQQYPISILKFTSRKKLAEQLDQEKDLDEEVELVPNFTGLAELINFDYKHICKFQAASSPTHALLDEWEQHRDKNPCIGALWTHLDKLNRLDVMEICKKCILNDIEAAKKAKPLAADGVLSKTGSVPDETLMLTKGDIEHGRPQFYDAFVCYNPDGEKDLSFVHRMASQLEDKNIRLCIPCRDDLPGQAEHIAYASLIKIRCRLMIIVLSTSYMDSDQCDFVTKFAHALSPATKKRRLVPVLVDNIEVPNILRHITLCDFTKDDMADWNWERLEKAMDMDWEETSPKQADTSVQKVKAGNKKKDRNIFSTIYRKVKNSKSHTESVK